MTHQITTPTADFEDDFSFDFNIETMGITIEATTTPESPEAAMARITHNQERQAQEADW